MEIVSNLDHCNFNVCDLEKSLAFYEKALGLKERRRREAADGSFVLAFLTDSRTDFSVELTWLRDREQPYDLGDNETHLCARVAGDYAEVKKFHAEMGVVCYENAEMGLYFIADPDDHWIEILPEK